MKQLVKDVQGVLKGLKEITKSTAKIVKAVEKLAKKQAAEKSKPKAKARAVKKAPAKKAAPKKAAPKKAAKASATDQVIKIIMRSKKGVDVPTLMTKTGFGEIKVRNIVFRAYKQGKIKKSGRGLYIG